jgi:hypothetical protein
MWMNGSKAANERAMRSCARSFPRSSTIPGVVGRNSRRVAFPDISAPSPPRHARRRWSWSADFSIRLGWHHAASCGGDCSSTRRLHGSGQSPRSPQVATSI